MHPVRLRSLRRAAVVTAVLTLLVSAAVAAAPAGAAGTKTTWVAKRVCAAAKGHRMSCFAMRLVAKRVSASAPAGTSSLYRLEPPAVPDWPPRATPLVSWTATGPVGTDGSGKPLPHALN